MDIRLPSRYEDLDPQFRGKLRPVPELNVLVQESYASMKVSGGIRFLPIFGKSGSGKSCAALELATHLSSCHLQLLTAAQLALPNQDLVSHLTREMDLFNQKDLFVWVVDQYEEKVPSQANIPAGFIERLSLLDRGQLRTNPMLFIWLTTDPRFQASLARATSRNERILVRPDFELVGVDRGDWPGIIEETFSFHNSGKELADCELLRTDIEQLCREVPTIGKAIETIGLKLRESGPRLQDLSEYQVIMLWPVVDGTGIERVTSFTNPSLGYTLNWSSWYNRLSANDRVQLPLPAYNRARLYFDFRLVPIPVADLHCVSARLNEEDHTPAESYLRQLRKTHFYTLVAGASEDRVFGTLKERDSQRARDARAWYGTATATPTAVGKRLAKCLTIIGFPSKHEYEIRSGHGRVVADLLAERPTGHQNKALIELKLFSSANTTPAKIRDEIRKTLLKYAHLAGYIPRQ